MIILSSKKLLCNLDVVIEYLQHRIVPPITVELDLTMSCNHHCPECAGGRTSDITMTLDFAKRCLSEVYDYGAKAVVLTGGGEPLLAPIVSEVVMHAAELGLRVGLTTNGSRLNENISTTLLEYCDWVRISLDSDSSKTFKRTHGMPLNEYSRVLKNIAGLVKKKKQYQSKCSVVVGYLVDGRTSPGMVRVTKQMVEIGIDYLHFRPFIGQGFISKNALAQCKQYETDSFSIMYSDACSTKPLCKYCHGAHLIAVIQADGMMPICCQLRGQPSFYIGNLNRQSFKEVWEGELKKSLLASINTLSCARECRYHQYNLLINQMLDKEYHNYFL